MKIAERVFKGQLAKVDTNAKTFQVTGGLAMVFNYDDETQIFGADRSIHGPAGKIGSQVKVSFVEYAGKYIATVVEMIEKNPQ